jgi:hypothetical protein
MRRLERALRFLFWIVLCNVVGALSGVVTVSVLALDQPVEAKCPAPSIGCEAR